MQDHNNPKSSNFRILIVDDNRMNIMMAKRPLDKAGFTTEVASHGQEALDKTPNFLPDLILMDLEMDVMDGWNATRILREQGSTTPIIALTGSNSREEKEKCLQSGMNDYVSKPFKPQHLVDICQQWTGLINSQKENTPKRESSQSSLYDLSRIREIAGDNDSFVQNMVQIFIQEAEKGIGAMQTHLIEENWIQIQKRAHQIKPSFGNMGISRIIPELTFLENPNTANDPDKYKTAVEKLQKVFNEVRNALQSEILS